MFFNSKENKKKKISVNLPASQLNVDPFTIDELESDIKRRMNAIQKEFKNGFGFIKKYPKTVTFFGSARFTPDSRYYKQAVKLSSLLTKERYAIVSGGGPGIMEAANKGASEAGGNSLGLTIELPFEQVTNPYLTDHVGFYYFFVRKVCLSFSAEAYVYFPGGFGTLDEFFEIITLIQTKKLEKVPVILVGSDFWKPLDDFIQKYLYEENKTISINDRDLYYILDNEQQIVDLIKEAPTKIGDGIHHSL